MIVNYHLSKTYEMARIIVFSLAAVWIGAIQQTYDVPSLLAWIMLVPVILSSIAMMFMRDKNSHVYRQFYMHSHFLDAVLITVGIIYTGGAASPLFVLYLPLIVGSGLIWFNLQSFQFIAGIALVYIAVSVIRSASVLHDQLMAAIIISVPTFIYVYFQVYGLIIDNQLEKERRRNLEYQQTDMKRRFKIMERKAQLAENRAYRDPLTGLFNHGYFQTQLREQMNLAYRYKTPVSLLMCDIDRFKFINDTYGHQFGDAVLGRVAKIITDSVRSNDIVARYGGEEMAVVLPQCSKEVAFQIAERIRTTLERERFEIEGVEDGVKVTISIGISESTGGELPEKLIARADQALYESKNNGRNRVSIYGE